MTQTEGGSEDVMLVELLNPEYDSGSQTLTYDVIVLDEYTGDGFGELVQQADPKLPETFGHTSLFIDDCPSITVCVNDVDSSRGFQRWSATIPGGPYGMCWSIATGPGNKRQHCELCQNDLAKNDLAQMCTDAYPDDSPKTPLWYACDRR